MRSDDYKQSYRKATYNFEGRFSYDEIEMRKFLSTLGYHFLEYKDVDEDDRYMETITTIKICAVKGDEKPDLYHNEIDRVFRSEFEKNLLSLLINARDMIYVATQKSNDSTL
jgi:hypothetical protein